MNVVLFVKPEIFIVAIRSRLCLTQMKVYIVRIKLDPKLVAHFRN